HATPVFPRPADPVMQDARRPPQQRPALAQAHPARPPDSSRLYAEFAYAAASWDQPWRVLLKAEVMAAGDNPRFVVTSLAAPTPQQTSEDIYCARGGSVSKVEMAAPMALICKVLFPSISTFETLPLNAS